MQHTPPGCSSVHDYQCRSAGAATVDRMRETTEVQRPFISTAAGLDRSVRSLLLLSGAFLTIQVFVTDYGVGNLGPSVLWFVVGCLLLWLVYSKRSRVARGLVIVTSLVGVGIYGFGALENASAAVLTLAYLGQALPLLMSPVRQHVRAGS
jgi:hypothetical protein